MSPKNLLILLLPRWLPALLISAVGIAVILHATKVADFLAH